MTDVGALYLAAQQSFLELADALADTDFAAPVPACPGWTVHDVVAHVTGITDDFHHGRMEGAATDPWTAAQVERSRGVPPREMLVRWREQAPPFADALRVMGERRPPIDCHTHEHDVRGGLARPGNRQNEVVAFAVERLVDGLDGVLTVPLVLHLETGEHRVGPLEGDAVGLALSGFELFRSRLGRRSRAQVEAYPWEGEAEPVVAHWFVFGPASEDLVE